MAPGPAGTLGPDLVSISETTCTFPYGDFRAKRDKGDG